MSIISTVSIAIAALLLILVLRDKNPEFAFLISVTVGTILLLGIIVQLLPIINEIKSLAELSSIDEDNILILLKALAVCFITQFCTDSCLDSGQKAIASKVELAGKVAVVYISIPLFQQILETVVSIIGS